MKITLIDKSIHANLLSIYKEFPALNLQNKGYEEINKNKLTELEKSKFDVVEHVLKQTICGFSRFQNFKTRNNGDIVLRFQYDYTAEDRSLGIPFIGVGYILLDELLNGFKETNKSD